ncbi:hypothetical protein FZC35_02075 [Candidatus Cytomitobacter indipagum]|uniref:Uncharacterized protein n=1 Tax=Candidatus Cytomitobacter indipagum TaxID=2601575 RepID=A0A5C0UFW3_9PROT|nr:hypothetical protein [Candidatus Cytomitobacter indipagum]QEK38152.1 hypothetical protein FZC35_02075 [Candidatus Cytomitobacter indipagum]
MTLFKLSKIKNTIYATGRVAMLSLPIYSYCTNIDCLLQKTQQQWGENVSCEEFKTIIKDECERKSMLRLSCKKARSLSQLNQEPYLIDKISSYIFNENDLVIGLLKYELSNNYFYCNAYPLSSVIKNFIERCNSQDLLKNKHNKCISNIK